MPSNYYAINAKIGALNKGILSNEDYENIISFSNREKIVEYLKDNVLYKDIIKKYFDYALEHRYATEFVIKKTEVEILVKLKHFLFGYAKSIIDVTLNRYEFEDIKLILRSIVEDEKIDLNKETLMYGIENHINYDKLSKCDNLSKAIDILKETSFKNAVMDLKNEDILKMHFHVEMNLDILYFKSFKNACMKLSSENRNILKKYNSELIDTMNIQWILRAKKYYYLSNEEIFNYSIRNGKYIKGVFLKELVYTESIEKIIEKINNSKLDVVFDDMKKESSTYRNIQGYVYNRLLKHLNLYQNTISTLFKFLITLFIQNDNLVRIAESKKYKLTPEETKKFLIRVN